MTPPSATLEAVSSTAVPSARIGDADRAIWNSLPPEIRARYADAAEGRLSEIKPYQLETAALTSFKRSAINATSMGGGKTLMALFHAYAINAHRTAVIVPTRVFDTWRRECARVNVPCVTIESAEDARRVRRELWEQRKAGRSLTTVTVYLISWEWLSLGGSSNRTYDPWYAFLTLDEAGLLAAAWLRAQTEGSVERITAETGQRFVEEAMADYESQVQRNPAKPPPAWGPAVRSIINLHLMTLQRSAVAREQNLVPPLPLIDIRRLFERDSEARQKNGQTVGILCESPSVESLAGEYRRLGLPIAKGQPYQYDAHHRSCPKCAASTPVWRGNHCKAPECRFDPRAYRSKPQCVDVKSRTSQHRRRFEGQRVSNRSYPGYRLLPKFDLKIVDEFHKVVSLTTIHGAAIFDVPATDTLLLSGTICRSYVTELEPALTLVHDEGSPEYPYARHDLSDFRDRFRSSSVRLDITRRNRPTILARTTIPEASNVNALRRLLLTRMVAVDDTLIEREWGLDRTPERIVPFALLPDEARRYDEVLSSVLNWRAQLMELLNSGNPQDRARAQASLGRGVRNRLDMVAAITNGPSKVAAAVEWVRAEAIRQRHRVIVACRSVALFEQLEEAFGRAGFKFAVCDETVDSESRDEFLTEFAASKVPILLTRIKLVCEAFNQLVCCTRQLMCEVERSPSDNRQFQKRMNRPGQRSRDIRCDLLVAALPNGEASIDEIEINRFLRKEAAIKEVTSRRARFRGAAAYLQAAQERRGMLNVLDDLASRVLSDMRPTDTPEAEPVEEPKPATPELAPPNEASAPVVPPSANEVMRTPVPAHEEQIFLLEDILTLVPAVAPPKREKSVRQKFRPAVRSYAQGLLPL